MVFAVRILVTSCENQQYPKQLAEKTRAIFFIQSEVKPKPILIGSISFFRASLVKKLDNCPLFTCQVSRRNNYDI